jgi:hypothetical protein
VSNTKRIKRPKGRPAALAEVHRQVQTMPKGSKVVAFLHHEGDCAMHAGEACSCTPRIELVPVSSPRHGVN